MVNEDNSRIVLRCGVVTLQLRLAGISEVRVDEGLISERYGVRQRRPRLVCLRSATYSRIDFSHG